MNDLSPFVRKIIYIALIGGLLIPLSLVSRPETRNGSGGIEDGGGELSRLREKYSLSQAKLAEIDPASETMKLASLGLRGVAVNVLWMQAIEHKKRENYDQLASTLEALTKIQPNFVKVWEFQAHNLAYNVSMEFDDYEYRYHWVKKGIAFLKKGIPYNKTDHRMTDNLGFFTGNKFGKSDEKDSFRRMFRQDAEFHKEMSDYVDPESYETRGYGPDSWKMAYQWYDYSRRLVEEQRGPQWTNDMIFYMYRPAQIRHQGLSLQNEYRTDEIIQEIWRGANEEWLEYGKQQLSNSLGVTITLEGMDENEKEVEKYRKQLDEFAPGVRDSLVGEMKEQARISDDDLYAWKLSLDQRNSEQVVAARRVNQTLNAFDSGLEDRIVAKVKPEDQLEAKRLAGEINRLNFQMQTIDRDSGTTNFSFWKARTGSESKDVTVRARQALFDAKEMKRRSIYDDEFDRDYKTKEVTITKLGAISLYLDAFKKWHEVLELYPSLKSGPTSDELAESMHNFQEMLATTSRDWPENFPLQDLVDFRHDAQEPDTLPTTEDLAELRSGLQEDKDAKRDARLTKKQQAPPTAILIPQAEISDEPAVPLDAAMQKELEEKIKAEQDKLKEDQKKRAEARKKEQVPEPKK